VNGLFTEYQFHPIDHREVQRIGNESRPDALDIVRSRTDGLLSQGLRDYWAGRGFYANRQDLLAHLLLDISRDAGDRTTRANARDEHVNRPFRVLPDLRSGGFDMDARVGWILELLQQDVALWIRSDNLLSLGD